MSNESGDLSAASAAALSHLEAPTPEAPASPTPAVEPPAPSPAPEGTATPEVATPKTYKVKVDGEELDVPEEELLNGYSRTAKFTKSMMQLAEQRKAFEAQVAEAAQREEAINTFFRDPRNIARYYEEVTGQKLSPAQAQAIAQQQPPPTPGADEFATVSTVQQLAQQSAAEKAAELHRQMQEQLSKTVAETQQWTAKQIEKARIEADQQRKAIEYQGEINTTVGSLLDQFPVLKAVEDIENVLCFDAQRMGPASLDEAKSALLNVAKARAEKLQAHFTEMQKQAAVNAAKLQTKGIEPPGGTGVAPTPTTFKLGDKALSLAAAEYIEGLSKKK